MLEQPFFGRRLKTLRAERGLSQAKLAGDGMSTGYVSRLESAERQPTERAAAYLAERLGVPASVFDEPFRPSPGGSLAQALTIAASAGSDEAVEALAGVLPRSREEDPALRWQALWLLAEVKGRRGDRAAERDCLEQLVALGDDVGLTELQVRALTRLATCLCALGEVARAAECAATAHALSQEHRLTERDAVLALLALVPVEVEAGRLRDAGDHADELCALAKDQTDTLRAEALSTAAAVRVRQGDHAAARELLEQALARLESRADLLAWVRLRLAAGSLYLRLSPPDVTAARTRLAEVEHAVALVGTPDLHQELTALQAHLAFHEGRTAQARVLCERLSGGDLHLNYRARARLASLHNRLLIIEGHTDTGTTRLLSLAQHAQEAGNMDLAAEIWRVLAETLAKTRTAG
ncbi:helix-turn-helix domain-containing protein [Streptomyces sp. ISL-11]|uniref:helix-turn-helix domain-containing protein n=1 Tax=Streptomyces sp. ISL-11 TaxID=2819174 RepID=UPI001BECFF7A|nr:helix-turn-helix domain-containing protein [Streptomyces sp. ISL-11]MBT2383347.1 helix-turn-helix domain-containing protein [Streptomyces sp. ISL-11]